MTAGPKRNQTTASPLAASPKEISVIIPALNERPLIAATVESVLRAGVGEVIVVDGGSTDGTADLAAAAGARVLGSAPGRGTQQNAGAAAARGNVLLFLHADTSLPEDFPARIAETLGWPGVAGGAFRFRIDDDGWPLRLVEWTVQWRCKLFQTPYGDQAIFAPAETFRAVGGFPDTPLLEDYQLIRRLRKAGRIATAEGDAVTSARRWRRLGVLRATWSNNLCLAAYWLGVSPERIARWRSSY